MGALHHPPVGADCEIRPRVCADIPACVALLAAVHRCDRYPEVWPPDAAAWLTPNGLVGAWLAARDREVVGHVVLSQPSAHLTELNDGMNLLEVKRLFVHPQARRSRVARMLLDTCVAAARSRAVDLVLEVFVDSAAAIARYERSGWQRTGQHRAKWTLQSGEHPLAYRYVLH